MIKELQESIRKAEETLRLIPDSFHGGLEHSRKVVGFAKEILGDEPLANPDITIVAAWWHDTGRIEGSEGHEKRSAQFAQDDLLERGLDSQFCRAVYRAIAHHRFDQKPSTLEGIIIRDADKLALFDSKRWEIAIRDKTYHKFEHTIHVLPIVKSDVLQRPVSLKIYKRVSADFRKFITDIEDEDFQHKKKEILALKF